MKGCAAASGQRIEASNAWPLLGALPHRHRWHLQPPWSAHRAHDESVTTPSCSYDVIKPAERKHGPGLFTTSSVSRTLWRLGRSAQDRANCSSDLPITLRVEFLYTRDERVLARKVDESVAVHVGVAPTTEFVARLRGADGECQSRSQHGVVLQPLEHRGIAFVSRVMDRPEKPEQLWLRGECVRVGVDHRCGEATFLGLTLVAIQDVELGLAGAVVGPRSVPHQHVPPCRERGHMLDEPVHDVNSLGWLLDRQQQRVDDP